jgi:hypothetical protein
MAVAIKPKPSYFRFRANLPLIQGGWQKRSKEEIFFRSDGGRSCHDIPFLTNKYPALGHQFWYRAIEKPNPDMGRTIEAFLAPPNPAGTKGAWDCIVIPDDESDRFVEQRTNGSKRRTPPGQLGEWIKETWHDNEFGPCLQDEQLWEPDKDGKRLVNLTKRAFGYYRRNKHAALDPAVNGGMIRFRLVRKPDSPKNNRTVVVSCLILQLHFPTCTSGGFQLQ